MLFKHLYGKSEFPWQFGFRSQIASGIGFFKMLLYEDQLRRLTDFAHFSGGNAVIKLSEEQSNCIMSLDMTAVNNAKTLGEKRPVITDLACSMKEGSMFPSIEVKDLVQCVLAAYLIKKRHSDAIIYYARDISWELVKQLEKSMQ